MLGIDLLQAGGRGMRLIDLFYQACIELNEEFSMPKKGEEE
jgi:hypothetical protein